MSLCRSKSTKSPPSIWSFNPILLFNAFKFDSLSTKSLLSGLYFTGLLKTILHVFREEMERPSTSVPWFLYSFRRLFQRSCFERTLAFPNIIRPYLARVKATFSLRGSFKKPIPEASLDRTHEKRMKSFSLP